ncbi:MAG: DNA integrity scanning protein DisA nucleotide-binding domain protein [Phycisphaerales bacterium]|nr:DNA integrity scanning protein DisA nucleotide-binding domain protein [Phycisphaerales bacterium]
MWEILNVLPSSGPDLWAVLIELVLIGLCVNWCAGVLQGTRGTRPLRGVILILLVATLLVRILAVRFEWDRLALLYRYVLYALAFIALVVFQPELRRAVIRVGDVRLRRRRGVQSQVVSALVKSAGFLSRNKYGALIAIQRGVDLSGWAENGTMIRGEVSANLLNTIFFPNNPLHDLGVIVRGNRVLAANCQFPAADSDEVDIALGSRHLAALGMSYETDALVLVVSEETGVISLADNGKLTRYLSLDDLSDELERRLAGRFFQGELGGASMNEQLSQVWRALRRVLVVVPITVIVWYVADQATYATDGCRIRLDVRPPAGREVVMDNVPLTFEASFSGPGRAIKRLRDTYSAEPLTVTWNLPEDFVPRAEPYVLSARERRLQRMIAESPEIRERGITPVEFSLSELRFHVHERITIPMPVEVRTEGGAVRVAVERVDPAQVQVNVRREDAARLQGQGHVVALLRRELEGLAPGDVRQFEGVSVVAPSGLVGSARILPERVQVNVRVLALARTVPNVGVRLYVDPEVADRYTVQRTDLNEWRVEVEVQADQAVLDAPGALDIRAFVLVDSSLMPPPGAAAEEIGRTLDVVFVTPRGVSIVGQRTVQVRLVPRPRALGAP